ncbi:MAG: Dam family site-specific DNA-(adenine-N6)-methyltransferase [Dysgonomonas sp.]
MAKEVIRSPFFYVGDKYKLIGEIKQYFPLKMNRFIEPFTGGGSVFLNIDAEEYCLNDIDNYIYMLHRFLIENSNSEKIFFERIESIIYEYNLSRSYKEDIVPDELKRQFNKTYYSRFNKENYNRLRDNFNNTGKTDMHKLYILLIYGFNRMLRFNSSGDFNLPVGNVDFNKNVKNALCNYFKTVKSRKINWYDKDYKAFIKEVIPTEKDFIYFDPPYLITFSEYNKLWNKEKEVEFVNFLDNINKKNIKFAVSNVTQYKEKTNHIFIQWSENYNIIPIKSNYISYHDNSIKNFNEVLVTNY